MLAEMLGVHLRAFDTFRFKNYMPIRLSQAKRLVMEVFQVAYARARISVA